MDTYSPKAKDQNREWYVVDVAEKVLGRVSSGIAVRLRGKHKPHFDNGDFIIVINADKIKVTGRKLDQKNYYRHSGYIGGLKTTSLRQLLASKPDQVIIKAVRGMLPKNRLGRALLKKLKVYAGTEHPHMAQNPKALSL